MPQIYDVRGSWTTLNREVVYSLFDSYDRYENIRKSLSTDVIKPIKVDVTAQGTSPAVIRRETV